MAAYEPHNAEVRRGVPEQPPKATIKEGKVCGCG